MVCLQFLRSFGGGDKGHKNCELEFCEPTGVSFLRLSSLEGAQTVKSLSANRELRGWRKRGCREGCQEQPEKGTKTVN